MEAEKTLSSYRVVHTDIEPVTSKTKWSVKRIIKTGPVLDLMIAAVVIIVSYNGFTSNGQLKTSKQDNLAAISTPAMTVKTDWRKLWGDQAFLTRNLIFCIIDGLPGTDHTINRLLQNQTAIGNAIKPFYGEETGNKLADLLKVHISLTMGIIKETAGGNTATLEKLKGVWYANAQQVSALLCRNNPGLMPATFKTAMNNYLHFTAEEAMQRQHQAYDTDMLAYDKATTEILKVADLIAEGITGQFPGEFK